MRYFNIVYINTQKSMPQFGQKKRFKDMNFIVKRVVGLVRPCSGQYMAGIAWGNP